MTGLSLIAANISTEQIVGQPGQGASNAGLAVASPVIYGILFFAAKNMAFLNRMAVTFGIILVLMALLTFFKPLDAAKEMPVHKGFENIKLENSVKYLGIGIIAVTLFLYVIFWKVTLNG